MGVVRQLYVEAMPACKWCQRRVYVPRVTVPRNHVIHVASVPFSCQLDYVATSPSPVEWMSTALRSDGVSLRRQRKIQELEKGWKSSSTKRGRMKCTAKASIRRNTTMSDPTYPSGCDGLCLPVSPSSWRWRGTVTLSA